MSLLELDFWSFIAFSMWRQYFSVKISFVNILWKTETYNAKIFCRINKKIETNEFFYRHLLHQLVNSIEKFRALFQKFSVKIWDDKNFLSTRLTKKCTFSSSGEFPLCPCRSLFFRFRVVGDRVLGDEAQSPIIHLFRRFGSRLSSFCAVSSGKYSSFFRDTLRFT